MFTSGRRKRPRFYHVPDLPSSHQVRHTSFTADLENITVRNTYISLLDQTPRTDDNPIEPPIALNGLSDFGVNNEGGTCTSRQQAQSVR